MKLTLFLDNECLGKKKSILLVSFRWSCFL